MPRRTRCDYAIAATIGGAAALVMAVQLTGWPVRFDVFDPIVNRGPARSLVEPLADRLGVIPASIVWGVAVAGLVVCLAPVFRSPEAATSEPTVAR